MKISIFDIGVFFDWAECPNCKNGSYGFWPNSHHGNVGMAIECDKCGRIVFFNDSKDPFIIKYDKEAPGGSTWQEFVDAFNASLEPCNCGGRYKFHNEGVPTYCLHCKINLKGEKWYNVLGEEKAKIKAKIENLLVNWMDRAKGIGPNDE